MKYTITKTKGREKTIIALRFDDECKNGHPFFAATCDIYEQRKNGKYVWRSGGCQHEQILKLCPKLEKFVKMHLSDHNGAPMCAIENGFYYMIDKAKTTEQRKNTSMSYLRITEQEYTELSRVKDKEYFAYMLEKLNIPVRWKLEAEEALKMLEGLTGETAAERSMKWTRSNYEPLTAEKYKEIDDKFNSGYYN